MNATECMESGIADPRQPVVRLDKVSTDYGGATVLRDVSLALWPGEIFVLLGPNGAGKTSLVRVLTGLLPPSAGSVTRAVVEGKPGLRAVRLVPQDVALYAWMTARENCIAFARAAGAGRREARLQAAEALDMTDCSAVSDIPVGRLSGGYKRRVNIATALFGKPRLLILDEPSAGVDVDARRAITRTLTTLKQTGLALLVITHDFDDADALADRAGFLFKGRMDRTGAPRALVQSVFGARKRIELRFDTPPGERQSRALAAAGARAASDASWTMFRDTVGWDAGALVAGLEADGVTMRELRMRDPGLEDLFGHFNESRAAAEGT